MSSVPMILITADRPKKLIDTGANQTINQYNIFGHYAKFFDLSKIKNSSKNKIISFAVDSYKYAMGFSLKNKGPVHLNIPFELPLHIKKRNALKFKENDLLIKDFQNNTKIKKVKYPKLNSFLKPIIIATDTKDKKIISLAEKYNIPIFMECRSLRFIKKSKNIISSYEFILKNRFIKPDFILRFGSKPISNSMNEFIDKNKEIVYLVKEGKIFNDDAKNIISCDLDALFNEFDKQKPKFDSDWLKVMIDNQIKINNYFKLLFNNSKQHEGYIINQIISYLPKNSNLMIGNSSPIRDLDQFTFNDSLGINIFSNRGASGIDGLIASSIGMSMHNKNNNFLILGDISFYYDISSLMNYSNIDFNLTIFIINNQGGHIFDRLEGLKSEKKYKEHWLTPINLNIKDLAKAFKCKYSKIGLNSYKDIKKSILNLKKVKGVKLIEINISSDKNMNINQKINQEVKNLLGV